MSYKTIRTMKLYKIILSLSFLYSFMCISSVDVNAYSSVGMRCYTISSGTTPVYNENFTKIGSIYGSDEITILGGVVISNRKMYKVRYGITGTNRTKDGYVYTDTIVLQTSGTWKETKVYLKTYNRPNGTNYGSINAGEKVLLMGNKDSWYQVRYWSTNGYYKFAWVSSSSTNTTTPTNTSSLSYYQSNIGKVLANISNYKTNLDGITAIRGQCVWYVRNRGYEKLGNKGLTGISGNANVWYSQAGSKGLSRGTTPQTNSIACWNGGSYGHVAYVEYYDSSSQTVYFTEANWGGSSSTDGVLKKMSLQSFKDRKSGYQGCIYLQSTGSLGSLVVVGSPNFAAPLLGSALAAPTGSSLAETTEDSMNDFDSSWNISESVKPSQKITLKKFAKTYKSRKLKKKKITFRIGANANGVISYKITKGSKKHISVSQSGIVTLKKKCKKGRYHILITAKPTNIYKEAKKTIVIYVK
ncbi:MAG: CHAP domain-containing protein [Lachnospiraceae bacterium]|nr:CHAP domain-containing protein [Lachnospiraceae bacterium]